MTKNININRPSVSSEEIAAHQNFQEVLIKYKKEKISFYRSPKFWGTITIAQKEFLLQQAEG